MKIVRHPLPAHAEEAREHLLELLQQIREEQHKQLAPMYSRLTIAKANGRLKHCDEVYATINETTLLFEQQVQPLLRALTDIESLRQISYLIPADQVPAGVRQEGR